MIKSEPLEKVVYLMLEMTRTMSSLCCALLVSGDAELLGWVR